MNPEWQSFLENNGANITAGVVSDFGDPMRERGATAGGDVRTDLSHLGLIRVQGEDAEKFLQGQLSNDIRQVTETHSQIAAYCSPKGRVLARFEVFKLGDAYYLQTAENVLEATLRRLRMFVLNSKVTLEDASDTLVRIGLSGPKAANNLARISMPAPSGIYETGQTGGCAVIRLPGEPPRYEIVGPAARLQQIWQDLETTTDAVGTANWGLLDITAGVPNVFAQTVEAFVPQMINLHAIDGISFTKGCYPGQEVVARTHHLGKLKRRMYRAHLDDDATPAPGTEIHGTLDGAPQVVGKVVEAQGTPGGGVALLAVLLVAAAEGGELHLGDAAGPELRLEGLPYEVPLEKTD